MYTSKMQKTEAWLNKTMARLELIASEYTKSVTVFNNTLTTLTTAQTQCDNKLNIVGGEKTHRNKGVKDEMSAVASATRVHNKAARNHDDITSRLRRALITATAAHEAAMAAHEAAIAAHEAAMFKVMVAATTKASLTRDKAIDAAAEASLTRDKAIDAAAEAAEAAAAHILATDITLVETDKSKKAMLIIEGITTSLL